MRIILADYKENGIHPVEVNYDAKTLDLEFVDFKYSKPIHLAGTIEKTDDVLVFRGLLSTEVDQMCGRCLEHTLGAMNESFDLFYDIKEKTEIETIDDLRELLILDHPLTFLCSEECKGLCPQCGTNLNVATCKCQLTNQPESLSSWKLAWMKKYGGNK
ncbi:MAG: hypothetical protein EXS63_01600 [Candidatus Omnitrophica bacterium]|nr:hypothetical protein [Candidatus Omnitrophota bacterium]